MLAKGHILSDEDVRLLKTEGMSQVWVTELEQGEVGEDEAVMAVGGAICCGSVEIRLAAGGTGQFNRYRGLLFAGRRRAAETD